MKATNHEKISDLVAKAIEMEKQGKYGHAERLLIQAFKREKDPQLKEHLKTSYRRIFHLQNQYLQGVTAQLDLLLKKHGVTDNA